MFLFHLWSFPFSLLVQAFAFPIVVFVFVLLVRSGGVLFPPLKACREDWFVLNVVHAALHQQLMRHLLDSTSSPS